MAYCQTGGHVADSWAWRADKVQQQHSARAAASSSCSPSQPPPTLPVECVCTARNAVCPKFVCIIMCKILPSYTRAMQISINMINFSFLSNCRNSCEILFKFQFCKRITELNIEIVSWLCHTISRRLLGFGQCNNLFRFRCRMQMNQPTRRTYLSYSGRLEHVLRAFPTWHVSFCHFLI